MRDPDGHTGGLREKRTFRPFFALSVGLGPVLGPPKGALVIAPSAASQLQSMPTSSSYGLATKATGLPHAHSPAATTTLHSCRTNQSETGPSISRGTTV